MIALSHHLKRDRTEFSRHGPVCCRPAAPRVLFTYWVVDMLMAVHSQRYLGHERLWEAYLHIT